MISVRCRLAAFFVGWLALSGCADLHAFSNTENRLTKTTFADATFTSVAYNAFGKQASVTDQLGHVTSYTYDARGNLTTTTYADTTTASSVYDAEGRVVSTTDRAGHVTTTTYDALGRVEPEGVMLYHLP